MPVIAPYADSREAVRKRHAGEGTAYLEVHVATPVEVCAERDVKGLYAKQAAGEITGLTGVDDPYEAPESPDLRIESHTADRAGVRRGAARAAHREGPGMTHRRHTCREGTGRPVRADATWTPWSPRRCTSSARWRASSSGR